MRAKNPYVKTKNYIDANINLMSKRIKDDLPELNLIDDKSIGERIMGIRKNKGLTQLELSSKIGIKRRLLSEYETGRVSISGDMVTRFAIALEVSADSLLGLEKIEES